jgi:hypothetical protein
MARRYVRENLWKASVFGAQGRKNRLIEFSTRTQRLSRNVVRSDELAHSNRCRLVWPGFEQGANLSGLTLAWLKRGASATSLKSDVAAGYQLPVECRAVAYGSAQGKE